MYDEKYKFGFYKQMLSFKNLLSTKKKTWPCCDIIESTETMKLANSMAKNNA